MPKIDLSIGWRIVIKKSEDEVAWLAAVELQETLQRIAHGLFPMSTNKPPDTPIFVLTHDDEAVDGFCWQAEPGYIRLHGTNRRGLLYAVYSFLEAIGCQWLAPGEKYTRNPRKKVYTLPDKEVCERAAFPVRSLVIGHHAFMADAPQWVEWAARNRLNNIFFHVTDSPYAIRAAPESQYQAKKDTVLRMANQRGMTIEHGGHMMSHLLPRTLFKKVPNAFRFNGGRRTPDHNFCPTSFEALSTIKANAIDYFRKHPEVDVFHLWPDDLAGGGWCECESCRSYTPAEQAMLATNALADVLKTVNPGAKISYLAYHDTEEVPAKVNPGSNVCLVWAPRRRCYAHAMNDKGCPVNSRDYQKRFAEQVKFMQGNGAEAVRVFEYYLDGILFKSVLPLLMSVMQEDLRFYRKSGVQAVQALMTGDRSWHTAELNPWMFGRLVWNPDQNIEMLVTEFSRALLGKNLWNYYQSLEAAYGFALDQTAEQSAPIVEASNLLAVLREPPTDIGDPVNATEKALHKKVKKNAEILPLLEEAQKALAKVKGRRYAQALAREEVSFELHHAWLNFDLRRVKLYNAVASKQPSREVRAALKETQAAFNKVLDWGRRNIEDKRYQRNFRFIHLIFWGLRLNKIRVQYFPLLPGKLILTLNSLVQVLETRRRMKNLYGESSHPADITPYHA